MVRDRAASRPSYVVERRCIIVVWLSHSKIVYDLVLMKMISLSKVSRELRYDDNYDIIGSAPPKIFGLLISRVMEHIFVELFGVRISY